MGRKTVKKELQEIVDLMDENELAYLELQHPRLGLVKLSKTHKIDVEDTGEDTGSITEVGDTGDFKITDADFLYAST